MPALTAQLRDIAQSHARQRGDAVRLPELHPVRLALTVPPGGGDTRERLVATGLLVPPRTRQGAVREHASGDLPARQHGLAVCGQGAARLRA